MRSLVKLDHVTPPHKQPPYDAKGENEEIEKSAACLTEKRICCAL